MRRKHRIRKRFREENDVTISVGDCLHFLRSIPTNSTQLVLTSPPYNIGKEYERAEEFEEYIEFQKLVIAECVRITRPGGSICWQLGNHVGKRGEVIPLDMVLYPVFREFSELYLRNRIVWHFEAGLHCQQRFSGRHECIVWFSKGREYTFNLDAVRVPQKYPGKLAYKGPRKGRPSGNPLGKNPGDVWGIPNVKANHVEKTAHPCQFPIALAETIILALTTTQDLVVDPFLGAGTTVIAALKNGRRAAGCDLFQKYVEIVRERISQLERNELPYRPRNQPVFCPPNGTRVTTPPKGFLRFRGQHT